MSEASRELTVTDHMLVIAKLKVKIKKEGRQAKRGNRRRDVLSLKRQKVKQEYQLELQNRCSNLKKKEVPGVNEEWNVLRETLRTVAKETIKIKRKEETTEHGLMMNVLQDQVRER